jgi:predicted metalloprotease
MRAGVPVGLGGLAVLLLLSWLTGADFLSLLGGGAGLAPGEAVGTGGPVSTTPEEERMVDFVGAVASDAQNTWEEILRGRYERTEVTLFRDVVQSACGLGQAATGPFYCPADRQVYLDLSFFNELDARFGAPGDFAQAYVVAHEIAHHVQNLLGHSERVQRDPRSGASSPSVALELQADCFAGIWGHRASQGGRFERGGVELEPGDAEEGLRAAAAIGDDRLQRMGSGRIAPEQFTHGTSARRVEWFRRGMETGDPRQCDTFARLTQ